jgi:hypothetical protein
MAWEQAIAILPFIAAFIFAYIGVNLDKENTPIRLLFILMSLWLVVIGVANGIEIVESLASAETEIIENLERGFSAVMWSAVVCTTYFVIMFLWRLFSWLAKIPKL